MFDKWSCSRVGVNGPLCSSPDLLLSPGIRTHSPPAGRFVRLNPLIHLEVMTHELLPELSGNVISVHLFSRLWRQFCSCGNCLSLFLSLCLSGVFLQGLVSQCRRSSVFICLMSSVFICGKYCLDKLYSKSFC